MVVLFLELRLVYWTHCCSLKWCTKCHIICSISWILKWLFPNIVPVRILFFPLLHLTPFTRRIQTQNQCFPSFIIRTPPPHNKHWLELAIIPILVNTFINCTSLHGFINSMNLSYHKAPVSISCLYHHYSGCTFWKRLSLFSKIATFSLPSTSGIKSNLCYHSSVVHLHRSKHSINLQKLCVLCYLKLMDCWTSSI